jgi:arylsulfatase A-like enzyme
MKIESPRRSANFFRELVTLLLLLAGAFAVTGLRAAEARPNFIFIITDDQRWDAMSVVQKEQGERGRYPWLQTPNLDRLASEGVRFRNAFVTLSLCSPSRATFLTGQYNHLNGVANNSTPFPMTNVTYASLMRDAGYATAFFGKFHHGKQRGPRPGFDYNATFIGQGQYWDCPFEVNGKLQPSKGWVDDVTTDFAIEYLKQHPDKPFSLFIGFKTPHAPVEPAQRALERFEGNKASTVPNLTTPAIFRLSGEDADRRRLAAEAIKSGKGVAVRLDYFRCISAVDDNLGRLMATLDELKLADNTVVVFTSDNGFYQGEHCLGDKRSVYDESLRIPMLVRYPKLFPKGKTVDQMILNLDLAPTFLDLAGIAVPQAMQGRSWRTLLTGGDPGWRKSFFAEYFIEREYPNTPTLVAVRTESAKLVKYPGHDEWTELFDLKNDPYETNNLAQVPAQAKLFAELSRELERQMQVTKYTMPNYADKAAFNPKDPPSDLKPLKQPAKP